MARPSGASPLVDGEARTVVLVRAGVAAPTEARARAGEVPGPPLTTRGRTQAAQAADAVFRIGKDLWPDLPRAGTLVAAPALRALETAAAVGRRIGQHPRPDERFAERDAGEQEAGEHAWDGLRDVVAGADPATTAVVVAHTTTIRALAGRALGAPPSAWSRLRVPPCSLTVLRLGPVADDGGLALQEVTAVAYPTAVP